MLRKAADGGSASLQEVEPGVRNLRQAIQRLLAVALEEQQARDWRRKRDRIEPSEVQQGETDRIGEEGSV